MLTKDIPLLNVFLTYKDIGNFPKKQLPDGFSFCTYEPGSGMDLAWVKLVVDYECFEGFGDAISYFNSVLMQEDQILTRQVVFVKNPEGDVIATAGLVKGNHFSTPSMRIAFFCVNHVYRNMGIGKAMLSALLQNYLDLDMKNGIYVLAQTRNYREIGLYISYGFSPYLGGRPQHWGGSDEQFEKNKPIAWNIIKEQIGEKYHRSAPPAEMR